MYRTTNRYISAYFILRGHHPRVGRGTRPNDPPEVVAFEFDTLDDAEARRLLEEYRATTSPYVDALHAVHKLWKMARAARRASWVAGNGD